MGYQNHFSNFQIATLSEYTIQSFRLYSLHTRHIAKIRRVLNEAGVKVAMKPIHTFCRILPSPKDPLLTLEEKSYLVYQVPCFNCGFVYIGQTKYGTLSHV